MGRGKRSKRPIARSPSPDPEEILEFVGEKQELLYQKRGNYPVVKGIVYNFETLDKHGFSDVTALIKHQGWVEFCEMFEPVNLNLVRKFYANLESSTDKSSLTSLYQGHTIILNPDIIRGFLVTIASENVLPKGGYHINLSKESFATLPQFTAVKDFNVLFEEQFHQVEPKLASHLTVNNRLLHHIVVNTIIPHEGSGTTLNKVHLCILWCLTRRIRIDLSYAIITHMIYARSRSRHAYPYAMLLTRYIMANFTVHTPEPLVVHSRKFNEVALGQLFKKTNDGDWIKTPANSAKRARSVSGPSSSVPSAAIVPASSNGSGPSWSAPSLSPSSLPTSSIPPPSPVFDHAKAYEDLMSRFDMLNVRFDGFNVRFDGMQTQLSTLTSTVNTLNQRINGLATYLHRETQLQRAHTESYGNTNMQMLLNLENCHRHLCSQLYNLNRRMFYMDNQMATYLHLEQPPAYSYHPFEPPATTSRSYEDVTPPASNQPPHQARSRGRGVFPSSNGT